jgi:hypothetical protein
MALFTKRDWWTRIWIIQEIAYAPKGTPRLWKDLYQLGQHI